jgi:hypothetical protein
VAAYIQPHNQINLNILTTVTLTSSYSAVPDDGDYSKTCWSCFTAKHVGAVLQQNMLELF